MATDTVSGRREPANQVLFIFDTRRCLRGLRRERVGKTQCDKRLPIDTDALCLAVDGVSPDGARIALVIQEGANYDVWVYDPERDALTRLTFGGVNQAPVWSPDGQYVVFLKLGAGLFQARADGASAPQALMESATALVPWSFTPDGKRLAYFTSSGNDRTRTVPLEDQGSQLKAGTPERFLTSSFQDLFPSFSPDGRWLAYHSNESGRNEVYVRAFPRRPPARADLRLRSGRHLRRRQAPRVDRLPRRRGRRELGSRPRRQTCRGGDPRRVRAGSCREHEIVMLFNFADELRRRVPPGK